MGISSELMEILACPECKGNVRLEESGEGIICDKCRIRYPVRDGIPVMIAEEAEKLGD